MDVLSDVCRALRLSGGIYFRAAFSGDWAIGVPASRGEVRFHLGLEGSCRVVVGEQACAVAAGDLVLIPHGAAQVLRSRRGHARPLALAKALEAGLHGDELQALAGGVARTRLLCGSCRVDDGGAHPLLAGLPPLIRLRPDDPRRLPGIGDALRVLTLEARQRGPGMEAIAARLVEVVFIQAIRDAASRRRGLPRRGFLAALADPHLAPALAALHADPARDWTVAALAREAGLSRTRFSERFARTTGATPIGYLRDWRLLSARRLLRESRLSIDAIAERVGYRSVPSFTRRFGAAFGIAPAAMRERSRQSP